jgi:ABC-type branched-subunit amino acid transport system substrate-binding protein
VSQEAFNPKYTYAFGGAAMNAQNCVLPGWFAKEYPDKKHVAIALPDTQMGHAQLPSTVASLEAFGIKATGVFYPQNQQDQSALGTRIKTMNPDGFMAIAGGPIMDGLCYRAAYQAGYRGQLFASHSAPAQSLAKVIPAEILEGFINMAWAVEFDNPLTDQAKAVKEAWIEKHGKWDDPDFLNTANYACIRAAVKKAGSIDVDKVADVISHGLEYEGPTTKYRMIDRPDLGNKRTVDAIAGYYFKRIEGGKPVKIHEVTFDEALGYFRKAFK